MTPKEAPKMRKCCAAASLCVLLLLFGCGVPVFEPAADATGAVDIGAVTFIRETVMLSEGSGNLGAPYGLSKTMEITEKTASFAFEPEIPEEDRAACIAATETILGRLGEGGIQVHIYTPETYNAAFVENGAVYTCLQDWHGPEYTVNLLYALLGDYCHYGVLYGFAAHLCSELFAYPLTMCEGELPLRGDEAFLDLNLLCFRESFVSADEAETAKKLAVSFAAEYMAANGEARLLHLAQSSGQLDGRGAFFDALAEFYARRDICCEPSDILYRPGGRGYDYIVKCDGAVMYIEKDWEDMNRDLCPYTYDGFLHKNYSDVRKYFTVSLGEMEQYRELFSLCPYRDGLKICFTNHRGNSSGYNAASHIIVLQNTASLSHEYIHALTMESIHKELWAVEGFANHFDCYYNHYGNAMSTVDLNTTDLMCVREYRELLGREIDMNTDYAEVSHVMAWCMNYTDPNDSGGYTAGASFVAYLVSRFGEEKVIGMVCETHDFGEYGYDALVADWQAFLRENYGHLKKVR